MSTILTETEGFTPVIDVLAQELGLMTAVVYGIVWRYCQMKNKVCSASRETIAEHANISVKTVDRHLDKLCKAGYLKDLHPDWKHRPHIYADTGKLKIEALIKVKGGETESPTSKEGETESPTGETLSPTGETESLTGETESPTKIPSYDSIHDSSLGKKTDSAFPENPDDAQTGDDSRREQDDGGADVATDTGGDDPVIHGPDLDNHRGHSGEIKADPLMMPFERHTAKARAQAGNFAAPAPAGGDDVAACAGLTALHEAKGGSPPRQGTGTYIKELEAISQALRDRWETDPEVAALAAQMFVDEKPKLACPHYKSFVGDYGEYLGRARGQLDKAPDRHDRYDTPTFRASQAAFFEERMASRPPPVEDDKVGAAIKCELQPQMTKNTFETLVRPARFTCDDDILTVTAPNAFTKDWLEDRLATTIQRTAVGILNATVEVVFEVSDA